MTRDQIELLCRNIQASTGDWKPEESILLKHDAEQRQVIEQFRKELELLKADDAERCTLIRDIEEEERRKDAVIEQRAQQIATLREALEGMLFIFGHHEGYAQVKAAQQALKEVTP